MGRRDYRKFSARLEKHLERLPDYAQRAQEGLERVQRYLPEQRPNPLRRPARSQPSITDVPVFAEVRTKWARWHDPAAKLARRKRRASRAMTLWIVLVLLCALMIVAGGLSGTTGVYLTSAAGIVFGTLAVRSGLRLRQLKRTSLP